MGAAIPVLSALAPIAGAGLMAYTMSKSMKGQGDQNAALLSSMSAQNSQNAIDTLPEAPTAPTGNEADAETNEAEAARQKQLQAMAANDAMVNPTGAMGLTTAAATKKRTLGGGN